VNVKIKQNLKFHEKGEKNIGICNVISRLVERKNNLKKVGVIYYGMELVIRKELKHVFLKMCTFFSQIFMGLEEIP
jgi:hypothetical protein